MARSSSRPRTRRPITKQARRPASPLEPVTRPLPRPTGMSVSAATTPTAWLTTSRTAALSRAAGERGNSPSAPRWSTGWVRPQQSWRSGTMNSSARTIRAETCSGQSARYRFDCCPPQKLAQATPASLAAGCTMVAACSPWSRYSCSPLSSCFAWVSQSFDRRVPSLRRISCFAVNWLTEFSYARTTLARPKPGPYETRLDALLEENAGKGKRQRLTLMRPFELLRAEGYGGSYDWGRVGGSPGDHVTQADRRVPKPRTGDETRASHGAPCVRNDADCGVAWLRFGGVRPGLSTARQRSNSEFRAS